MFTCWFLPVDQRWTHKIIKSPVQRLTLATPRLRFKRFFSQFHKSSFRSQTLTMTTPSSSSVCICVGERSAFESALICSGRKVLFTLMDAFIYPVLERNLKPALVCNCADSCWDLRSGCGSGNTLCFLALNQRPPCVLRCVPKMFSLPGSHCNGRQHLWEGA